MPKSNIKFDWEIYTADGEFYDILTMTRKECEKFKIDNPTFNVRVVISNKENDGDYFTCETDNEKKRSI